MAISRSALPAGCRARSPAEPQPPPPTRGRPCGAWRASRGRGLDVFVCGIQQLADRSQRLVQCAAAHCRLHALAQHPARSHQPRVDRLWARRLWSPSDGGAAAGMVACVADVGVVGRASAVGSVVVAMGSGRQGGLLKRPTHELPLGTGHSLARSVRSLRRLIVWDPPSATCFSVCNTRNRLAWAGCHAGVPGGGRDPWSVYIAPPTEQAGPVEDAPLAAEGGLRRRHGGSPMRWAARAAGRRLEILQGGHMAALWKSLPAA
jgi:hypothetical protein